MTDEEHANNIRGAVIDLRNAIVDAREAGLEVEIPIMLNVWLQTGHPPGEPEAWTIKRRTL